MGTQPSHSAGSQTTMRILILSLLSLHLAQSVDIPPHNYLTDTSSYQLYRPEKAPEIPVKLGERRCDNSYDGGVPPCLLRPWLPPYSYSTTEVDNGEYRRRKRASRVWRAIFRR